ncbi:MAG: hypothetical protein WA510_08635 [Acidobacteriaceae bacterium]
MTGQKSATPPGAAMPQPDPDSLELAPGTEHLNLEGWIPDLSSEAELLGALEKAFDYRGDVTITCKDGSVVEGYIFDRQTGQSLAQSWVRLFPKDSPDKRSIAYSDVAGLNFSGKDRAAGASWEAWVNKWKEKRAAGEKGFGLHPEALD